MSRRISTIIASDIIRLYYRDIPIKLIARKYNMSIYSISRTITRYGLVRRTQLYKVTRYDKSRLEKTINR